MPRPPTSQLATVRWLALGSIVGPVLFNLGWMVLSPFHPGYSNVSQPVSAIELGPNGSIMRATYILFGLLVTPGVISGFQSLKDELGAIQRWVCSVLLALSPLGMLWAGIFTMDQLDLHNIGVQLAIATPVLTFIIVGLVLRRTSSWRRFGTLMILGSPLTLIILIGFINSVPASQLATGGGNFGLWQRVLGNEVFVWFVALGWLAFTRARRLAMRGVSHTSAMALAATH
jgi:hypothetical protein